MLQGHLPIFPSGVTYINPRLAFKKEDGKVTYFNFSMPIFSHMEDDVNTFRMIMSQFYTSGHVTQAEIARTFGVTDISIKRAVKLYRTKGCGGFYAPRNVRGAAVLTDDVLYEIQEMLNNGASIADISDTKNIKRNTIEKAIRASRLKCYKKNFRRWKQ